MNTNRLKIVAMGTGPFAVPAFDAIAKSNHEIQLVITRPQPPIKSRGGPPPSPVDDWAKENGYQVEQPASINDPDAIALVQNLQPDLLVVCDYGQILKPAALATAKLGGINLHGSLLPAYRGAAPVQRALLSGDPKTGVSVIHMTPKLDGGPLLTSRTTDIQPQETAGQLEERLSDIGVEATLEAIAMLIAWDNESVIGQLQDPSLISKAPRLSKSEGLIDWSQSSHMIDCHVRGMQPWPVAYTFFPVSAKKPPVRLQIKSVSITDLTLSDNSLPGHLICGEGFDGLLVATQDGILRINSLQPAGKKEMTGEAFANGYQPQHDASFVNSAN